MNGRDGEGRGGESKREKKTRLHREYDHRYFLFQKFRKTIILFLHCDDNEMNPLSQLFKLRLSYHIRVGANLALDFLTVTSMLGQSGDQNNQ